MSDFNFSDVGITLPTLQSIEEKNLEELKIVAKFRHHESGWTWYVITGNNMGDDWDLYCYVVSPLASELGFVYLSDILNNGAMFCPTFKPCYLKEIMK